MKGFAKSAVILALSGKAFHFPVYQKSGSCVGMTAKGWMDSLVEMWVQSIMTVGPDTQGQGEGELKKAVLHGKKRNEKETLHPLHFCSAINAILPHSCFY